MKEQEYLEEIRKNPGFPRAILADITVEKQTKKVIFHLITDVTYSVTDFENAAASSQRFLPSGWKAEVSVSKLVADERAIREKILRLLAEHSPAVAAFIRPEDVTVEKDGFAARFCLDVTPEEMKLLRAKEIVDGVTRDLNRAFCGSFTGAIRETAKREEEEPEDWAADDEPEEPEPLPVRFFPVTDYAAIDGGKRPERAAYIADCNREEAELVVCGKITDVQERQTAKGKPFFQFVLSDGTGRMRATYFSKQATIEKVRALSVGESIVCAGSNELYNGGLSFHAKTINRGGMPENFEIERRESRAVPAAYRTVFPEPYEDFTQSNLFDDFSLPPALTEHDFVVFDLETTGLNNLAAGGVMDSIIEVGAVKLKKGKVAERFSTFVAYDRKLPAEIVELTGIHDEQLVGAPPVGKVIPDFYKFCDGCFLVGHNVLFDYRFIEYYAEKEGYRFEQRRFDTLSLGQELLKLSNYKLNTLADYYGISFNHHRAFDDALATAKIFVELIRKRKTLPEE